MRPSAEMMMQAAQAALNDLVAPAVTDQWAASALRSVDVILSHLRARVPIEGTMLYEDNTDLAILLAAVRSTGVFRQENGADGDVLDAALADFAVRAETLRRGYPSVEKLSELNIRGREIVDDLLRLCHGRGGEPMAVSLHQDLRSYLNRHLERERAFFFPTYVGRPV